MGSLSLRSYKWTCSLDNWSTNPFLVTSIFRQTMTCINCNPFMIMKKGFSTLSKNKNLQKIIESKTKIIIGK